MSTDTIDEIPVQAIAFEGRGPGWVEFDVSTANSNALDISAIGELGLNDLEAVASLDHRSVSRR
jgi:hypothetical protein